MVLERLSKQTVSVDKGEEGKRRRERGNSYVPMWS